MATPFEQKKHRLGLLYGLVAGVAFSFFAWGLDAIRLANAHVAYPYAKFVPAHAWEDLISASMLNPPATARGFFISVLI
ncbi:MAG TPA: hypothetical protein DCG78_05825 [Anaerolineaceae bacterium]|nr:hypothetical protein [Anaerolineaceae bacterium]